MWTGLWPGRREEEVPIGHITNGVHVPHLAGAADARTSTTATWARTGSDRSGEPRIWGRHRGRRRRRAVGDAPGAQGPAARLRPPPRRASRPQRRGEPPAAVEQARRALDPDALTIGFARRFATYKRADLMLPRPRAAGRAGQRPGAAGPVRLRRQGPPARRARQDACCSRSPA